MSETQQIGITLLTAIFGAGLLFFLFFNWLERDRFWGRWGLIFIGVCLVLAVVLMAFGVFG